MAGIIQIRSRAYQSRVSERRAAPCGAVRAVLPSAKATRHQHRQTHQEAGEQPQIHRCQQDVIAPVRYFTAAEGGVSHFNYWRDNVLLTSMYLRLLPGLLMRLPVLMARRFG